MKYRSRGSFWLKYGHFFSDVLNLWECLGERGAPDICNHSQLSNAKRKLNALPSPPPLCFMLGYMSTCVHQHMPNTVCLNSSMMMPVKYTPTLLLLRNTLFFWMMALCLIFSPNCVAVNWPSYQWIVCPNAHMLVGDSSVLRVSCADTLTK